MSWEEQGILLTTSSAGNRFEMTISQFKYPTAYGQGISTIDSNHIATYIVSGIYGTSHDRGFRRKIEAITYFRPTDS